jgi:beta-xylosidase
MRAVRPLSCPDPSVIGADRGRWRYFLFCTSDNARNAFPIWMSEDLTHWYPNGYVFPYGRQPYWAVPSDGRSHTGLFWAPSIYRIQNRWVIYFAAEYNAASHALGSAPIEPGTMVIGVATANSLAGPWRTKMLHYPGQFNAVNARAQQEIAGGDIDPGVVRDPRTGPALPVLGTAATAHLGGGAVARRNDAGAQRPRGDRSHQALGV